MKEITIGNNEKNQRVDKYMAKYLSKAPKSFIYKMFRKKNITLNNKKISGNEIINSGDIIKMFLSDETIDKFRENNENIIRNVKNSVKEKLDKNKIIYEDENVLLYNKPTGILSQKANKDDISINDIILNYLIDKKDVSVSNLNTFKPSICNRLDRNTSGMIIFGKSFEFIKEVSTALKYRYLHKKYICLVKGNINKDKHIKGYLIKDDKKNIVKILDSNQENEASFIETYYRPLYSRDNITFLEVTLITGKTHQIRSHLASVNHPIVGDNKYGDVKFNKYFSDKYKIKNQMLHSYLLEIEGLGNDMEYLNGKKFIAMPEKKFLEVMDGENIKWEPGIQED